MTGVGARPEVGLEGSLDGKVWHEYRFKYKPGDPFRRPQLVAPHQPRLDWQMWFAALGPIGQNGWLATLSARLLQDSAPARALLEDVQPFDGPPKFIRAKLYDYHYAPALLPSANRSESAVSGCLGAPGKPSPPATCVCHRSCKACGYSTAPNGKEDCVTCADSTSALHPVYNDGTGVCVRVVDGNTSAWWTRRYRSEYLHKISLDDTSIKSFLADLGFGKIKKLEPKKCAASGLCRGLVALREVIAAPLETYLLPISLGLAWGLRRLCETLWPGRRRASAGWPKSPKEKQS